MAPPGKGKTALATDGAPFELTSDCPPSAASSSDPWNKRDAGCRRGPPCRQGPGGGGAE